MDNAVLTVSQSEKNLTPIKRKKIKKYESFHLKIDKAIC